MHAQEALGLTAALGALLNPSDADSQEEHLPMLFDDVPLDLVPVILVLFAERKELPVDDPAGSLEAGFPGAGRRQRLVKSFSWYAKPHGGLDQKRRWMPLDQHRATGVSI